MNVPPLFYDLEVFSQMNMAGFLNADHEGYVIVNAPYLPTSVHEVRGAKVYINSEKMRNHAEKLLTTDSYNLFGFNNHNYDDYLINDILRNRPLSYIKLKSDTIVKKERFREQLDWWSYDLREQMPLGFSLKKFESMAGLQVEESSIPWDKPDEFTIDEILEVAQYNILDLQATSALYDERKGYFIGKSLLVEEYGHEGSQRYSNGSISAGYLMGRNKLIDYKPEPSKIYGVPTGVQIFLETAEHYSPIVSSLKTSAEREKLKRKIYTELKMEAHGMVYTWAWGGLHGAKGSITTNKRGTKKIVYDLVDDTNVVQWDVTSMFPSIMIRDNLLGNATEKFKNLVAERVKNKKVNKSLAGTQKIVINSVYGLLRLLSSRLFNPESAIHVNISGMVALYNLCDRLSPFVDLRQCNTDGLAFKVHEGVTDAQLDRIKSDWEEEFQLGLEIDMFDRLIQRDVNNYIGVDGDHIKLKGGAVSQGVKVDVTKASTPTIIDYMLVQRLVYDVPFIKSVHGGEFRDYTFTLKAMKSPTQTGKMVLNGETLTNEVNRVYGAIEGHEILKEKSKGENAKFPDVPLSVNVANYKLPRDTPIDLDYNYYIELAEKKLEKWLPQ